MDENERYVRSRWKAMGNLWWDREYDENWISASDDKGQPIRIFRGRSTDAEAWSAAAAFTREREEQIRQAREDLSTISSVFTFGGDDEFDASLKRIYAREQAHLAALLVGWRTDADERKEAQS